MEVCTVPHIQYQESLLSKFCCLAEWAPPTPTSQLYSAYLFAFSGFFHVNMFVLKYFFFFYSLNSNVVEEKKTGLLKSI